MIDLKVPALNSSVQKSYEWLTKLVELGPAENEDQAYSQLRAVIHAIRDRLTVEEASHLGAQLPTLICGAYYEGWKPALAPNKERTADEFRDSVAHSLRATAETSPEDLDASITAMFRLLEEQVDSGELRHVRGMLPDAILEAFWTH